MLAGGIYGIIRWQQGNCKRQRHIRAWIKFLELAEFQVLRNHSAVSVILERAKGINAQMDICFAEILEKMKKRECSNGHGIWQMVFLKHQKEWGFDEYEWETVMEVGNALFGHSSDRIGRELQTQREQFWDFLKEERERYKQNSKVVIPAGLFGSLFVIMIFI